MLLDSLKVSDDQALARDISQYYFYHSLYSILSHNAVLIFYILEMKIYQQFCQYILVVVYVVKIATRLQKHYTGPKTNYKLNLN